jgi:hypothetical protein
MDRVKLRTNLSIERPKEEKVVKKCKNYVLKHNFRA